jgi:hypothetical protein
MLAQHDRRPWHPLYSSLKVNRARQHWRELDERIEAFGKLRPYDVVTGEVPEWRSVDPDKFPEVTFEHGPPEIIAGCLGDCLQDYKSALDHALYHLTVLYNGNGHPGLDKIEFPIVATESEYRRKRKRLLEGLPIATRAFIDELQPYLKPAGAERQSLYALWELARIDRHRHIHVMSQAIMGPGTVSFGPSTSEVGAAPTPLGSTSSLYVRHTVPGMPVTFTTPLSIVVNEPTIGVFPLREGLMDIDLAQSGG